MLKKISLCVRLTIMTGLILLLCTVLLTFFASYNASVQLTTAVKAATPAAPTVVTQGTFTEVGPISTFLPSVETVAVTEAKHRFDIAGLISFAVISILGTAAVYFATKRALDPLLELNKQIAAITENSLDIRVSGGQRSDEVGNLCRSFNTMPERLNQSFSAQKRFSANVAHELKTPLTTMQASIQVMKLDQSHTIDEYEKVFSTLERNTDRLQSIIHDLMRLCDEQELLDQEQISLPELFSEIMTELLPKIEAKHITYAINCNEYSSVVGDPGLLYRAFFNLIENAVKYNREGGTICISSHYDGSICEVHIKDTGNGIPQEQLPMIFEPFYRGDPSRSRKMGGAGLGLSVVKTIVERHGWSIAVESQVGLGSEFVIRSYRV